MPRHKREGSMRLEDKVALITGAASGMGASMARIFAREGAKVVVADVLEEEGRAVVADITQANGAAIFRRLDVSSEAEWKAAVDATLAEFGKLDIVVNDAGLSGSAVEDLFDTAAWDQLMAVNARGVFLGMKFAIPIMKAAGGGSIVNISSISGITGQHGIHVAYNASKGAVRTLTKAAAVQHGADITNAESPQAIDRNRAAVAVEQPAQECPGRFIEGIDFAVAEVPDQQIVGEIAKPGRRDGEPPG